MYDDTCCSSRGFFVNVRERFFARRGIERLCNWRRTLLCSAGNAFCHLVGQCYEFCWLGQRADFVHRELELPCTCSACSERPSLEIQSAQCSSLWRCTGKARPEHQNKTFYDVLRTKKLTEEVLITTFCLFEQSLNNLPLKPVSSDPNDLEALTPNHFLLGHRAVSFPALDFEQNFNHRKRYSRAQSYANAIWTC